MRDGSATPIRMGIRRVSVIEAYGDHGVKPSLHRPAILAWGLALLIAACGMLVSTPGAQAAGHRGAVLVKDINPGRSPSVTNIDGGDCGCIYNGGDLTDVRGTLYFSANDGKHGYELWRSDGTARGTRMVKDINPGKGWSNLSGITAVNRIVYFTADDGVHGAELWRSDGTARGTRMVKDINPGGQSGVPPPSPTSTASSTSPLSTAPIAGLWRSDGTAAGTTLVKAIGALALTDVNGTLYFASSGGFYSELWRSDGTEAGTTLVKTATSSAPRASPTSTEPSTSAPATPIPRQRALAKRRHRGRHDDRQGLRPGLRLLQPTSTGILYITAPPDPAPSRMSCGEATAPRTARPLSSRSGAASRPQRHQGGTLYFSAGEGYGEATAPRRERRSSRETEAASPSR